MTEHRNSKRAKEDHEFKGGSDQSIERVPLSRTLGTKGLILRARIYSIPPPSNFFDRFLFSPLSGTPVTVAANCFTILFRPKKIYRVLCEFEPQVDPHETTRRRGIIRRYSKELDELFDSSQIFDGQCFISLIPLANGSAEIENKDIGVRLHLRQIREIDTVPVTSELVAVVNSAFKKLLTNLKLLRWGRKYFYPTPEGNSDGTGYKLKLYSGFFATINPTIDNLQLTIDLTHRVVSAISIRDQMDKIIAGRTLNPKIEQQVNDALKGTVCVTPYNNLLWRIDRIDFTKSYNNTFTRSDGSTITFGQYYEETYHLKLSNPKPGIIVNVAKKGNRETFIMPEFARATGVTDAMHADGKLMKWLSSSTRKDPNERLKKIVALVEKLNKNSKQEMTNLQFEIQEKPTSVTGRTLPNFEISLPEQEYRLSSNKNFGSVTRNCGFFNNKMKSCTPEVKAWGVVFIERDDSAVKEFCRTFIELSRSAHCSIDSKPNVYRLKELSSSDSRSEADTFSQWSQSLDKCADKRCSFVMVFIPRGDRAIYSFVKYYTSSDEAKTPMITQCIDTAHLYSAKNLLKPIAGNTLRQLMNKLNYPSWTVNHTKYLSSDINSAFKRGTMVCGVDISHEKQHHEAFGAAGRETKGSVGGFASSYDDSFNLFYSQVFLTEARQDFVSKAADLLASALEKYKTVNGKYPNNIIMYRDGVGDSQLDAFVHRETLLYRQALQSLDASNVQLTMLVVQKNINTRFFYKCPKYASRGKDNCNADRCTGRAEYHSPLAGTCIDSGVVSNDFNDFYLVPSQAPPNSTATPTRYIVTTDDLGISVDDLQQFTNQLCYRYQNWPGPIRVPAAVMYAHKIAYLFGRNLYGYPNSHLTDKLFFL